MKDIEYLKGLKIPGEVNNEEYRAGRNDCIDIILRDLQAEVKEERVEEGPETRYYKSSINPTGRYKKEVKDDWIKKAYLELMEIINKSSSGEVWITDFNKVILSNLPKEKEVKEDSKIEYIYCHSCFYKNVAKQNFGGVKYKIGKCCRCGQKGDYCLGCVV